MRVLWFFVYAIGFMVGLPMLVLFLVQDRIGVMQWPPPPPVVQVSDPVWAVQGGAFVQPAVLLAAAGPVADIRAAIPGAEAAAAAAAADGSIAVAVSAQSMDSLPTALAALETMYRIQGLGRSPDGIRVSAFDGRMTGFQLRRDRRALLVLGPDEETAKKRLAGLPGLVGAATLVPVKAATARQMTWVATGVGLWALLQFFLFGRVASWAARVAPDPRIVPVGLEALKSRLMAINGLNVPFTVSPGRRPNELYVDWRYADAKWLDHMRVHGMRRSYRMVLRLDGGPHNVRVMERWSSLDWSAGGGPDLGRLSWKTHYGITFFHYAHERVFGLRIVNGRPTLNPTYAYTFNLQEMKQPVIEIIINAGWTYKPVITFFRPIGG